MKEYTIVKIKKARGNQGNCLVCGKEIKAGDAFSRLSWPNPRKVFFCANCEVDQSLIGKNKNNSSSVVVTEKVAEKADVDVEQMLKSLIAKTECKEEKETDKAFCSKCNGYHTVGSRRYRQHIAK